MSYWDKLISDINKKFPNAEFDGRTGPLAVAFAFLIAVIILMLFLAAN